MAILLDVRFFRPSPIVDSDNFDILFKKRV